MNQTENQTWTWNVQKSFSSFVQICLVFAISWLPIILLKTKPHTFHLADGLILFMFFYLLYLKRYRIQMVYPKYHIAIDFVLILGAILWFILFRGFRKIDLGLSLSITPGMWIETAIYSVVWITIGVTLAVKIGFISFAGWKIDVRKVLPIAVYLFFMALIEEIFFRGLILNYLRQFFPVFVLIPFMLSVLIFGYAHLKKNGITMVFLASLAGIFYGLIYLRTGNIWCATVIHTLTNVCRWVFFKTNREGR